MPSFKCSFCGQVWYGWADSKECPECGHQEKSQVEKSNEKPQNYDYPGCVESNSLL